MYFEHSLDSLDLMFKLIKYERLRHRFYYEVSKKLYAITLHVQISAWQIAPNWGKLGSGGTQYVRMSKHKNNLGQPA